MVETDAAHKKIKYVYLWRRLPRCTVLVEAQDFGCTSTSCKTARVYRLHWERNSDIFRFQRHRETLEDLKLASVPYRAFTRHHGETLHYGNSFPPTFPEVPLAHTSLTDWPIVVKHANMPSSRGSINAEPVTITSESFPS